jgi:hypothetical protein
MWGCAAATVGSDATARGREVLFVGLQTRAEGFERTCDFGLASAVAKPQRFSTI